MEGLEPQQDVCHVEPHYVFVESPTYVQVEVQLTAWAVLHHQEQLRFGLEGVVQSDEEIALVRLQNLSLELGQLSLLLLSNSALIEYFYGVDLAVVLFSRQEDPYVGSIAQQLHHLEVV